MRTFHGQQQDVLQSLQLRHSEPVAPPLVVEVARRERVVRRRDASEDGGGAGGGVGGCAVLVGVPADGEPAVGGLDVLELSPVLVAQAEG